MTKVVNIKTHGRKHKDFVYIGRGGKWGNPFVIGKDGTRDEVVKKYGTWLLTQHELLEDLINLKGKTLGCWCAPEQCHGDILVRMLHD